jgi:hypothetical protein
MLSKGFVYYLGLDLGGAADYSALTIVEESVCADPSGWISPSDLPPDYLDHILGRARQRGRLPNPPLSVRHLERFEPGTSYPQIVERVGELIHTPRSHTPRSRASRRYCSWTKPVWALG